MAQCKHNALLYNMWVAHKEACELLCICLRDITNLRTEFITDGRLVVENALETRPRFYFTCSENCEETYSAITLGADQINFAGPPTYEKIAPQLSKLLAAPKSSFLRTVNLISALKQKPTAADLHPASIRAAKNNPL